MTRRSRLLIVEGGGDNHALKTECRRGFARFLEKTGDFEGRMPRIIAGGGRHQAYKKFCSALAEAAADDVLVLLVDSEAPVSSRSSWEHVHSRQGDGWAQPAGADDAQLHLMVECMESWFLADPEALADFYGQGFQTSALPSSAYVEGLAKRAVYTALEKATRATKRGPYGKGEHSFKLLALLDPAKVRSASPAAEALLTRLREVL